MKSSGFEFIQTCIYFMLLYPIINVSLHQCGQHATYFFNPSLRLYTSPCCMPERSTPPARQRSSPSSTCCVIGSLKFTAHRLRSPLMRWWLGSRADGNSSNTTLRNPRSIISNLLDYATVQTGMFSTYSPTTAHRLRMTLPLIPTV